jgi:hypothetical protein
VEQVSGPQGGGPATVKLAGGAKVAARKGVVVAVEEPEANRLLGKAIEVRPGRVHSKGLVHDFQFCRQRELWQCLTRYETGFAL